MKINGLIVAAGMSRRMGSFKPLLQINGRPMIEQSIRCMLTAGTEEIALVLGYRGQEIEQTLRQDAGLYAHLHILWNHDYETTDMLHSVRIGAAGLPACDAFYLLPGDMPAVNPATLRRLRWIFDGSEKDIIFPAIEGRRKHPPLIASRYLERIRTFHSNEGLRALWHELEPQIGSFDADDPGCSIDVDTPRQYDFVCRYMA